MPGVRVVEMHGGWLENQHDIVATLFQIEEGFGVWLELAAGPDAPRGGEDLTAVLWAMFILKKAEVSPGHRTRSMWLSILSSYTLVLGLGI